MNLVDAVLWPLDCYGKFWEKHIKQEGPPYDWGTESNQVVLPTHHNSAEHWKSVKDNDEAIAQTLCKGEWEHEPLKNIRGSINAVLCTVDDTDARVQLNRIIDYIDSIVEQ